jgi:hypothetical protein
MLTYADACSRIEECVAELKDEDDAPIESAHMRSKTCAHMRCSRTGLKVWLVYYYVCWRMLAYADVC